MTNPALLHLGAATQRMLDRLAPHFEIHSGPDADALIAERGSAVEYIMCGGGGAVPASLMRKLPHLKLVSNFGVGYDNIDVAEAVRRGVMVTHTPDVLNDEVANTALLLLLSVARNLLHDEDWARSGKWEAQGAAPLSRSIRGAKVGILGLGRIGETLAEKLGVFGVQIAYHNRSRKDVPWDYHDTPVGLAKACDIVISVLPGGGATHHLVDAAVLDALGPRGIFVNIGRGSVVDEQALVAALADGRLGAAGLDVFEHEPAIPAALRAMPNVVLLPHVGSATVETRQAMGDLVVDNLIAFHTGGRAVTPVPECRGR